MSQIKIYFGEVSSANQVLRRALRELSDLEAEFAQLQKIIDPEIQRRYQIAEKLSALRSSAGAAQTKARRLLTVTDEGLQRYRETESRLRRSAPEDNN